MADPNLLIYLYCRDGDEKNNKIKELIPKCSHDKEYFDVNGSNALFWAFQNKLNVATELYKSNIFTINNTNAFNLNGLSYAIITNKKSYDDITADMIRCANKEILNCTYDCDNTLLTIAALNKNFYIAEKILDHKDFDNICQINNVGRTALEILISKYDIYDDDITGNNASSQTYERVIHKILDRDKKSVEHITQSKHTMAMLSMFHELPEEITDKILELSSRENILKINNLDESVLTFAFVRKKINATRKIINKNPNSLSYKYKNLPLSLNIINSAIFSTEEAVKLILLNTESLFYHDENNVGKCIITDIRLERDVNELVRKLITVNFTNSQNELLVQSMFYDQRTSFKIDYHNMSAFIKTKNINIRNIKFLNNEDINNFLKNTLAYNDIELINNIYRTLDISEFIFSNTHKIFMLACKNNLTKLAYYIINNDIKSQLGTINNMSGEICIFDYINKDNINIFRTLFEKYPNLNTKLNFQVLIGRFNNNTEGTEEKLINQFKGLRMLNINFDITNKFGSTILMLACSNKLIKLSTYLIELHNQKVNIGLTLTNKFGDDVMSLAILFKLDPVIVKLLDYNHFRSDKYINALVNYDKQNNTIEIKRKLIELSIYDESYIDDNKNNYLMMCCKYGFEDYALKFLHDFKYSLQNNDGDTALILACKNKLKQIIKALLADDENINVNINVFNKENMSAITLCCNKDLIEFLPEMITKASNKNKLNVLEYLTENKNIESLDTIYQSCNNDKVMKQFQKWVSNKKYEGIIFKTKISKHPAFEYLQKLTVLPRISDNLCILCACETTQYYVFSPCQHAFLIDEVCIGKIPKCPFCRQVITQYAKLYLV